MLETINMANGFLVKKLQILCSLDRPICLNFTSYIKELQMILYFYSSNSAQNIVWKVDVPIRYFILPLVMQNRNSEISAVCHRLAKFEHY